MVLRFYWDQAGLAELLSYDNYVAGHHGIHKHDSDEVVCTGYSLHILWKGISYIFFPLIL